VVLVDPGWNAAEALAALEEGLATVGAKLEDVRGVLVTHLHPDHYGLAGRVREVSGAWVALPPDDAALIPARYQAAGDPLAAYLASLERLRRWGGGLALPGHEWRFEGLAGRIDELLAHHERRLDAVEAAVAAGAQTIWEVATRTAWSRPWEEIHGFMRRAALGETAAHLVHLEGRGRLERVAGSPPRWRVGGQAGPVAPDSQAR
jgi:glyoxylase-like metal-dependent hydrolase (beta-lactamase superfamily II)